MPLEIVSSQTDADLAEREARSKADWALRELTANLLRVAAGAGRPHSITGQIVDALNAFHAYRMEVGHYPDAQIIADALDYEDERPSHREDYSERVFAERQIVKQSLRVTASKMLGQRTQASTAMHEVYEGIRKIEREREMERAKWRTPAASKRALQAALIGASRKTPKKKR